MDDIERMKTLQSLKNLVHYESSLSFWKITIGSINVGSQISSANEVLDDVASMDKSRPTAS